MSHEFVAALERSDFLLPVDHEGRQFDFHALRHTCGAWLAMAGENPKTIQTIMRHSTITLTMDTLRAPVPGGRIRRHRPPGKAIAGRCGQ